MKSTLSQKYLLLALMAGALLFAQIMGVHRHLQSDATSALHASASVVHLADAGFHDDDHHAADAAGEEHQADHAHGDVEISALGAALAKLTLKLLPIGLLMLATFLILQRVPRRVPRALAADPPSRRHPFSLHPPANGPPRLFSTAV